MTGAQGDEVAAGVEAGREIARTLELLRSGATRAELDAVGVEPRRVRRVAAVLDRWEDARAARSAGSASAARSAATTVTSATTTVSGDPS